MNNDDVRQNMIDGQLRPHQVTDPILLEAFEKIPREAFLPERYHPIAYSDTTITIAEDDFLIEPRLAGKMLQHCALLSTDSVLIVGGGHYLAAIAAQIASIVFTIETKQEKIAECDQIMQQLNILNIVSILSSFEKGWPKEAPYNVILFNGAIAELPDIYTSSLEEGGRMIAVLHQQDAPTGEARLWIKKRGILSSRPLFDASLPFLTASSFQESFVF